jgi:hypothetical protein
MAGPLRIDNLVHYDIETIRPVLGSLCFGALYMAGNARVGNDAYPRPRARRDFNEEQQSG